MHFTNRSPCSYTYCMLQRVLSNITLQKYSSVPFEIPTSIHRAQGIRQHEICTKLQIQEQNVENIAHHISAVTNFLFLRLSRHNNDLGCWVEDFSLSSNCRCITGDKQLIQMIDHHLAHSCSATHHKSINHDIN